jgi:hypothetical protein
MKVRWRNAGSAATALDRAGIPRDPVIGFGLNPY